jgi:hypothetical protein
MRAASSAAAAASSAAMRAVMGAALWVEVSGGVLEVFIPAIDFQRRYQPVGSPVEASFEIWE